MRVAALKVLRKEVFEYVRLAAGRETVLATVKGQAVARLVPREEDLGAVLRYPFPFTMAECRAWHVFLHNGGTA